MAEVNAADQKPVVVPNQEGIFDLIFTSDELSWQSIIYELVRTNQMNPWDIDIKVLAAKYIDLVRTLKKMDFRLSGKIILAAAILLKIKSNRLVGEDLNYLDSLFAQREEQDYSDFEDEFQKSIDNIDTSQLHLIPRTPAARKRKVSIYDLIDALQKAMEVKKRRVMRDLPPIGLKIPERKQDITKMIKEVYMRILGFFKTQSRLTFSQLIPESPSKEDKVFTFIPLLHLENARRVNMSQPEHFGEIDIELLRLKKKEPINP